LLNNEKGHPHRFLTNSVVDQQTAKYRVKRGSICRWKRGWPPVAEWRSDHCELSPDQAQALILAGKLAGDDFGKGEVLVEEALKTARYLVSALAEPIERMTQLLVRRGSMDQAYIRAFAAKHHIIDPIVAPRAAPPSARGIALEVLCEDGTRAIEGEIGGVPYRRRLDGGHLVASRRGKP
jgi:hypothetical protein